MDSKTKEYYIYCGIKTGWHDKSFKDFTNDGDALDAVKKYLSNSKDASKKGIGLYLWGSNGTGKCLGKGTKVIRSNLTTALVEDIKVGDKLLRPDGGYNTVLALSHGVDQMYRVSSKRFMPYVVNSRHVLSLKFMADDDIYAFKKGEILNIPIEDFLGKSPSFKRLFGGWKPGLMQFDEHEVPIDPYFLGTWLGDGDSNAAILTSMDATIVRYWRKFAESNGWKLRKFSDRHRINNRSKGYNIVTNSKGRTNPLRKILSSLGLIGNKHIPMCYIKNSVDVRLRLLAGLLDTDGFRSKGTKSYEIIQKREHLIDEIVLLCRTLGINCRKTEKRINGVTYYKTHISIEDVAVPCRLQRKIPTARVRGTETRVSSISVESIGLGEYYGFQLDGDHLFCLEDFTVTHNSHLMNCSFKRLISEGYKVRVYSMDEIVDKFTSSWYSDEDKKELDNVLRNIDFLGIDEFGKNIDKDGNPVYLPDLVKRVMESVIRFRVQMCRPIWFASNTDPKYVKEVFSEDIASLLREAVIPLCVRGEDFRREIQRRNKRKFLEI